MIICIINNIFQETALHNSVSLLTIATSLFNDESQVKPLHTVKKGYIIMTLDIYMVNTAIKMSDGISRGPTPKR